MSRHKTLLRTEATCLIKQGSGGCRKIWNHNQPVLAESAQKRRLRYFGSKNVYILAFEMSPF